MELYRSKYEAYPFLADEDGDLRCDFEILTDEIASLTGLLLARLPDEALRGEVTWVCELVYHMNPTLRTFLSATPEELARLAGMVEALDQSLGERARFVLPQGCEAACTAHVLRVKCKALVRLLYRHGQRGHTVPPLLLDLGNLLSGYFFLLALALNARAGVAEIAYESRNYR